MASDVMHGLPSPSRGRSRASARSCYSTVSPSPEELWTEQQTELAPIYATPGTPYPLPWPPRSPCTKLEVQRVLEAREESVATSAWLQAPRSTKAAAVEVVQHGKRKAPLRPGSTAGPRPTSMSMTPSPATAGPFIPRPSTTSSLTSFPPAATYMAGRAGGRWTASPLVSPVIRPRPLTTPNGRAGDSSDGGGGAVNVWTRPVSQSPYHWTTDPPGLALRSAGGKLKGGVQAAVAAAAGAHPSDAAVAAAGLAWDLPPPVEPPLADAPLGPLFPPAPTARQRQLDGSACPGHVGACVSRVAAKAERHKAHTQQWQRRGAAPPAAVDRARRHAALPLLSPQSLADWELLLEPSRQQAMAQAAQVAGLLRMAPPSPSGAPLGWSGAMPHAGAGVLASGFAPSAMGSSFSPRSHGQPHPSALQHSVPQQASFNHQQQQQQAATMAADGHVGHEASFSANAAQPRLPEAAGAGQGAAGTESGAELWGEEEDQGWSGYSASVPTTYPADTTFASPFPGPGSSSPPDLTVRATYPALPRSPEHGPVPAATAAFHNEYLRLHQRVQQQHGLPSGLAEQGQQGQQEEGEMVEVGGEMASSNHDHPHQSLLLSPRVEAEGSVTNLSSGGGSQGSCGGQWEQQQEAEKQQQQQDQEGEAAHAQLLHSLPAGAPGDAARALSQAASHSSSARSTSSQLRYTPVSSRQEYSLSHLVPGEQSVGSGEQSVGSGEQLLGSGEQSAGSEAAVPEERLLGAHEPAGQLVLGQQSVGSELSGVGAQSKGMRVQADAGEGVVQGERSANAAQLPAAGQRPRYSLGAEPSMGARSSLGARSSVGSEQSAGVAVRPRYSVGAEPSMGARSSLGARSSAASSQGSASRQQSSGGAAARRRESVGAEPSMGAGSSVVSEPSIAELDPSAGLQRFLQEAGEEQEEAGVQGARVSLMAQGRAGRSRYSVGAEASMGSRSSLGSEPSAAAQQPSVGGVGVAHLPRPVVMESSMDCEVELGEEQGQQQGQQGPQAAGTGGQAAAAAAATTTSAGSKADAGSGGAAGSGGGDSEDVEGDEGQMPVKTSGIGYTVVKSVQVWQPDDGALQDSLRTQQLEQLREQLGGVNGGMNAAKLRAGSRAAKALQQQTGRSDSMGSLTGLPASGQESGPASEGVSMVRVAPASRPRSIAGDGQPMPQGTTPKASPKRPSLQALPHVHPRLSPSSLSGSPLGPSHLSTSLPAVGTGAAPPRASLQAPQASPHPHGPLTHVEFTTKAGKAGVQDVWVG